MLFFFFAVFLIYCGLFVSPLSLPVTTGALFVASVRSISAPCRKNFAMASSNIVLCPLIRSDKKAVKKRALKRMEPFLDLFAVKRVDFDVHFLFKERIIF